VIFIPDRVQASPSGANRKVSNWLGAGGATACCGGGGVTGSVPVLIRWPSLFVALILRRRGDTQKKTHYI
jgi:hypothetical protein